MSFETFKLNQTKMSYIDSADKLKEVINSNELSVPVDLLGICAYAELTIGFCNALLDGLTQGEFAKLARTSVPVCTAEFLARKDINNTLHGAIEMMASYLARLEMINIHPKNIENFKVAHKKITKLYEENVRILDSLPLIIKTLINDGLEKKEEKPQ